MTEKPLKRSSGGFTIVEVVVAIVVFTLGILGLVGTAATVTRMVGRSQQYNMSASLAQQRVEMLLAAGCGSMASGTATSGAYTVTWTVASTSGGLGRSIGITVTYRTAAGMRTDTFTSAASCVA